MKQGNISSAGSKHPKHYEKTFNQRHIQVLREHHTMQSKAEFGFVDYQIVRFFSSGHPESKNMIYVSMYKN
jgi:hypothetical protein